MLSNDCNYSVDSGTPEYTTKSLTWESRISVDRVDQFCLYFAGHLMTMFRSFKTNFGEIVGADAKILGEFPESSPSNISRTVELSTMKFGTMKQSQQFLPPVIFPDFSDGGVRVH